MNFYTLYCTTLPHNLIKEKLLDYIEWFPKRAGPLPVTKEARSLLPNTKTI